MSNGSEEVIAERIPMSGDPKFNRWYRDRDFTEVKSGNDSIIATIDRPSELNKVITIHNELLDELDLSKNRVYLRVLHELKSNPSPDGKRWAQYLQTLEVKARILG